VTTITNQPRPEAAWDANRTFGWLAIVKSDDEERPDILSFDSAHEAAQYVGQYVLEHQDRVCRVSITMVEFVEPFDINTSIDRLIKKNDK